MHPQLSLHFSQPPSYAAEDWLVGAPNAEASELALNPAHWAGYGLLLVGPHGSGKTHLAHLFSVQTNAVWLTKEALAAEETATLLQGRTHAVLDDIEALPPAQLLYALQAVQLQPSTRLLLTARHLPHDMQHLPADICSRLEALPKAVLSAPDDFLIEGILRKQLQDAQIQLPPQTLAYLLPRLERSYPAIRACVLWLISLAEGEGQRLTIPAIKLAAQQHLPEGFDVNGF